MQVLIKIDEARFKDIQRIAEVQLDRRTDTVEQLIANGTPIPDNATNGEVIMAMFPNLNVYEHSGGATYSVNNEYNFNATWWNSPYQKGGKE